ncbi:MAG: Flp pilus assembly protein CpaB [Candidatus Melainabacteria bacterium]|nr:Flp pilus assembly protein CpaB [Candidatus Melainabacteria bacterium]
MNPLRALFLSLSRMPPAVMLLIIVGLAVMVTMMVTGKMGESERMAKEQEAALKAKYEAKGTVVYATKDIPEGATISADALEEREELQSKISPDALVSSSMAVGRIAKYGLQAGQLLSSHDLAPMNVSAGFESRIKDGHRAVTFAVDSNSGVAGFVAPGSHVDVIAIVGGGAQTKAQPILSDVEVIAVGQLWQKDSGTSGSSGGVPAASVTVGVSTQDAEKLIKGVKAGSLYLTLRNDKDHTPVAVVDVTSLFEKPQTLASLPPPGAVLPPPPLPGVPGGKLEAAPPPPPPLHEIELWSGSKKEVLSVPKS